MLFWTIIFVVFYLVSLVKGNLLHNAIIKTRQLVLEQAQTESKKKIDELNMQIMCAGYPIYFVLLLVIIEVIYIYNAMFINMCEYPSIAAMFYMVICVFISALNNKNKFDLKTEEGRFLYKHETEKLKRYSLKSTVIRLGWLSYFVYMFYILIIR